MSLHSCNLSQLFKLQCSNNVERRLGVSVIVLYALVLTKALAAYQFYQVDRAAGRWLAATLTWLTAAAALETRTWQINPDPTTGKPEPLYPSKEENKWRTRFRWET
jgi:TspO/MBR family